MLKTLSFPLSVDLPISTNKQSIGFLLNAEPERTHQEVRSLQHVGPVTPVKTARQHRNSARRRPAQCSLCSRIFSEASAARKHMRVVHMKLKAYSCGTCRRRFAERSNLKKHVVALHQGARSHPCSICGKSFSFSDGLRRHINNRHLGLRPHACGLCSATFKQRTHLQKHQTSVHSESSTAKAYAFSPSRV